MLLPELYIPFKVNKQALTQGMDQIDRCADRQHFLSYPHQVQYQYNSRGFRDQEWPQDLSNVIWCVGDSFTVGTGAPREHTWSYLLQQRTGCRTINVGMDGASNNWISRIARDILNEFPTATVVVHWSYWHRREMTPEQAQDVIFAEFYRDVAAPSWPRVTRFEQLPPHIQQECTEMHGWRTPIICAENRAAHNEKYATAQQDLDNTLACMNMLGDQVIHTAIPLWGSKGYSTAWPGLIEIKQLDHARDHHHYDLITATDLVDKIMLVLASRATQ